MITVEQLKAKVLGRGPGDETPVLVTVERGPLARVGALWPRQGWYAEVSNFQVPRTADGVDYCDGSEDAPGEYGFCCGVEGGLGYLAGAVDGMRWAFDTLDLIECGGLEAL